MRTLRTPCTERPSIVLTLVIVSLASCASSGTGSGSSNSTVTAPATATKAAPANLSDYCSLVSPAEVSQATGLTTTQVTPIANQARQQVLCGYAADVSTSTGAVITYFVSTTSGQAQTTYSALRQQAVSGGATVADLSGIGDQAFSITQNSVNSVAVLKGSVVFLTSGTTPHPLPLNADTALARLVVSKL